MVQMMIIILNDERDEYFACEGPIPDKGDIIEMPGRQIVVTKKRWKMRSSHIGGLQSMTVEIEAVDTD